MPKKNLGQYFFRLKADVSIKEKSYDGKSMLTKGKIYYDKNIKKLTYQISFPEKEKWLLTDTLMYRITTDSVFKEHTFVNIPEFSIFHISLSGNLNNFGLANSFYSISEVEKENDMVITTWQPKKEAGDKYGPIVMSQKDNKLYGIVFINKENKILSKHFFRDYVNINGFIFPGEVIQIVYIGDKENYKITTYKNIVLNDLQEENMYDYSIPSN